MNWIWPTHGDFQVSIHCKDFVSRFLATNARMGVAVALATHDGIYGAMLFAARFLATNARMGVAVALATHDGIYGAMLFAARFLATNARMVVAVWVAPKTQHSCIRG